MNTNAAEALARALADGSFRPTQLEDCKSVLPTDANPHRVRYAQIALFTNSDQQVANDPAYVVFNFSHAADAGEINRRIVQPIAGKLVKDLITERLPDQGAPIEAIRDAVRNVAAQLPARPREPVAGGYGFDSLRGIETVVGTGPDIVAKGLPNLEQADDELRQEYVDWLSEQRRHELLSLFEPLEKAGLISAHDLPVEVDALRQAIESVLTRIILPPPFRPYSDPQPKFALCATFEQEWQPKGYTRGELINTMGLAPGEQLTLEVHSWDKSTVKSEQELLMESEMRVGQTLTQRDTQTVVAEMTSQYDSGFDFGVTIPVDVPINVGANVSDSVTNSFQRTNERTHENTREAANTLKNSRKVRIEVARETGRDEKQTRTIANTNRCHTLNCHYFEVMSNYLVTTKLASVEPCLLFPNPKERVTRRWVLCHENVLRRVLLDRTFLPGFDAAKYLEVEHGLRLGGILTNPVALPGRHLQPATGVSQEELERQQDQILAHYRELREALNGVKRHVQEGYAVSSDPRAWALYVAVKSGLSRLRRALYFALLHADGSTVYALQQLESDKQRRTPGEALVNFFSTTTPAAFQFGHPIEGATLAVGLEMVGIPRKLVDALTGWGIVDLAHLDDAGLNKDVGGSAQAAMEQTGTGGTGSGDPGTGAGGTSTEAPPGAPDIPSPGQEAREEERARKIRQAHVEFRRLKCHIDFHWPHYFQAIWLSEHPDVRFARLQSAFGFLASVVRNEIIGFHGDCAAYAIVDRKALKEWLQANIPALENYEEQIAEIRKQVEDNQPEPQLITLPTSGTFLEAMVGECDACEDFVRQSRVIDLRMQEAQAKQEESEASRYERRVENGDYLDPKAQKAGRFIVKIEKDEDETS